MAEQLLAAEGLAEKHVERSFLALVGQFGFGLWLASTLAPTRRISAFFLCFAVLPLLLLAIDGIYLERGLASSIENS